jgi:hypothetical protein
VKNLNKVGLISNFQEVSGEPWNTRGMIALKFIRARETLGEDLTGMVPPGMITSADTDLGATLSPGRGALGVQLAECPIPEDRLEALYQKGLEMSEESEHNWVNVLQSNWVAELAQKLQQTFFEQSDIDSPTVQVWWNPDRAAKTRILRAEIIMTGTPNGHPYWDGNEVM